MPGSKEKWNAKYGAKSSFSKEPDPFLVEHVHLFKPGSVLDFACGTGRNALWLAKKGYTVDGADISEVGLDLLETEAKANQLTVRTMVIDLTDQEQLNDLQTYDNLIINLYKPSPKVLLELPKHLNKGGILLICTHNWHQVAAGKFKKQYSLGPNELMDLNWQMKLVQHASFENNSGFYDGYVFEKL